MANDKYLALISQKYCTNLFECVAHGPIGLLQIKLQGCKIPLARSHLRVKCYAGRVKV